MKTLTETGNAARQALACAKETIALIEDTSKIMLSYISGEDEGFAGGGGATATAFLQKIKDANDKLLDAHLNAVRALQTRKSENQAMITEEKIKNPSRRDGDCFIISLFNRFSFNIEGREGSVPLVLIFSELSSLVEHLKQKSLSSDRKEKLIEDVKITIDEIKKSPDTVKHFELDKKKRGIEIDELFENIDKAIDFITMEAEENAVNQIGKIQDEFNHRSIVIEQSIRRMQVMKMREDGNRRDVDPNPGITDSQL